MPDTQIREDAVTPARLPTCDNHINQSMVAHESAAFIFYLEDGAADCSKGSYISTSLHGVIFMAAAVRSCYLPVNNTQERKTVAICVRIRV